MANLKPPKVPKPLRQSLSLYNLTKPLNYSSNLKDNLIVFLHDDTALRLSELANIERIVIDFQHRTIVVWSKGARQRRVAYGEVKDRILRDYLSESGRGEKLFELLPRGVAQILRRLGEETRITCNAHKFRRTFATQSIRNEMNVFHVQSLLGHSSLTMTRIYAEQVNSEDAVKAYKAVVR
jgi:integrase/recombinase XerC/integrase/recombinase XerD